MTADDQRSHQVDALDSPTDSLVRLEKALVHRVVRDTRELQDRVAVVGRESTPYFWCVPATTPTFRCLVLEEIPAIDGVLIVLEEPSIALTARSRPDASLADRQHHPLDAVAAGIVPSTFG